MTLEKAILLVTTETLRACEDVDVDLRGAKVSTTHTVDSTTGDLLAVGRRVVLRDGTKVLVEVDVLDLTTHTRVTHPVH